MKKTAYLIKTLREKGIGVNIQGENLEVSILNKDNEIDDDTLSILKENKNQIKEYLQSLSQHEVLEVIPVIQEDSSYDISNAQRRIWFSSQIEEVSIAYNMPASITLHGEYNIEHLTKAIESVVDRHEILRTVFEYDSEKEVVKQRVVTISDIEFKVFYKEFHQEEQSFRKAKAYISERVNIPFDLEKGPLLRVSILRVKKDEYILFYNMHHIISDGWSMNILFKDIIAYYRYYNEGKALELPTLKIQYKDYANWQRNKLTSGALDAHKEYWTSSLSGTIPKIDLPSKNNRLPEKSHNGRRLKVVLPKRISSKLKTYTHAHKGTEFMGALSILNVLIFRYLNLCDIALGIPIAGREHADLKNQIGFYVNTLVLRNQLKADDSFNDVFEKVKANTLNAYTYQEYPFDILLEDLNISRETNRNPLFDIMLNFLNVTKGGSENTTVDKTEIGQIKDQGFIYPKYDIDILIEASEEYWSLTLDYNSDAYKKEAMSDLINHFIAILDAVCDNPEEKISKISYLSEQEKDKLLYSFNETTTAYQEKGIIELFSEQVKLFPENIAVKYENESFTFLEVDALSNKFASYLNTKHQISSNDRVVISLDHNQYLIPVLIAVKKLKAVYVPVDPIMPEERLLFIKEDSQSSIIIDAAFLEVMNNEAEEKSFDIQEDHHTNPVEFIIYTSGSTGVPKGVLLRSNSVYNRLHWMWKNYPFMSGEVCCAKTSISFVDHIWEFFGPLLQGIPLVFYKKNEILDVQNFIESLSREKISRIVLVPSLLRELLSYSDICKEKLQHLKIWISSGEALREEDVKRFYNVMQNKEVRLLNIYGSTELTADAMYFDTYEAYNPYKKIKLFDDSLKDELAKLISEHDASTKIIKNPFKEIIKNVDFNSPDIERNYTTDEYLKLLKAEILPNVVNVNSPSFIGHMAGPIPKVVRELNEVVVALNQNQVKIETSAIATLIERQVIGFFHKTIYQENNGFYEENIQNPNTSLGVATNGGTISNIMVLNYALNKALAPDKQFKGLKSEGLVEALKHYGYKDVVVIGSERCHYSIGKALKILGLGTNSFVGLNYEGKTAKEIQDELAHKIKTLQDEKTLVVSIIAIAGATESGNIDPLELLGNIALKNNIHYHVDAAFGGSFLLADEFKDKFKGISLADSVSVCAHKQLYLPVGLSYCIFKKPAFAVHSENNSNYQARKGSYDLGKYTLEGSRNFSSFIVHGILNIYGKEAFSEIIVYNYKNAQQFAKKIQGYEEFKLLFQPDLNIVLYRYIPTTLRHKKVFTDTELELINQINHQIQQQQFDAGNSFVSYTKIQRQNAMEDLVLRAVFMNPYTTAEDLENILEEQRALGCQIEDVPFVEKEKNVGKNVSLGKPIDNVKIYILDEYANILPVGVVGEICVSGDCVSEGYLRNTNVESNKFMDSPFVKGERMYRTGDLGKRLRDGSIEFIGRNDSQIKIRGNRIELGDIENALSNLDYIKSNVVVTATQDSGQKILVAYVTTDKEVPNENIRKALAEKLPNYMLPSYFVQLDEFPLNSSGKIDKNKLPSLEEIGTYSNTSFEVASTINEQLLVQVCENVLKQSPISLTDNFYNLGGDSIKSIQIVSRLRQHGLIIKPEDILTTDTLKDLAKLIVKIEREIDQAAVTGTVILTPSQKVFLNSNQLLETSNDNQTVLLQTQRQLESELLEKTIKALTIHHDALRMTFKHQEEGIIQYNEDISKKHYVFTSYDLTAVKDTQAEMTRLLEDAQKSFNLLKNPILHVHHFKLPNEDQVALLSHPIVMDAVSWQIVLEDISNTYTNLEKGLHSNLPLKTDAFQTWANAQKYYAQEVLNAKEVAYWENVTAQTTSEFPVDTLLDETVVLDANMSFKLDQKTTKLLQNEVHAVYNTETNDILLTALSLGILKSFGVTESIIELRGDDRPRVIENINTNRTVGCFSNVYPFILLANSSSNTETLIQIKESLRSVPHQGIGYGILKYSTNEFSKEIQPDIVFNYLDGTISQENNSLFHLKANELNNNLSTSNGTEKLNVLCTLIDGSLEVNVNYASQVYHEKTIQTFISLYESELKVLIESIIATKEPVLTPSDLSFKGLSIKELKALNTDYTLEDIYKISPLQEGMYFHWLRANKSRMYFEQTSYKLTGVKFSINSLKGAYEKLVSRHGVLRTSFSNDYAGELLQIVRKEVVGGFSYEKFPEKLTATQQKEYIERIKKEDIEQGFDLNVASQMRLKVIDLGNESYEFIWSYHHILMDGWCLSILINEFTSLYASLENGSAPILPKPTPYSNYIQWLKTVQKEETNAYWKAYLSSYETVAEIPFKQADNSLDSTNQLEESYVIKDELYASLESYCNTLGITQNTFICGIWGYLLSKYNNTNDVVFGSVVSGRPAELDDVENMIGLFINTIPVRVQYDVQTKAIDLLKQLQHESIASTKHHYNNLASVQDQSTLGSDLINHILVFENYAVQETVGETSNWTDSKLTVEEGDRVTQTNYDFTIIAIPQKRSLALKFKYNGNLYVEDKIKRIAKHLENIILEVVNNKDVTLSNINYLDTEEQVRILEEFNDTKTLYPKNKSCITLFKEQVEKTPKNTALCFQDIQLTYDELDKLSSQFATYLQTHHKVKPNTTVGIKLPRSQWQIIALLGVLKTGAIYAPIDYKYPQNRIDFIINDSNCTTVIEENTIDDFVNLQHEITEQLEAHTGKVDDIVYVMYTSGSTGTPKGVKVTHQNIVRLVKETNFYQFSEADTLLSTGSFSFDATTIEFFGTLLNGGCLVIPTYEVLMNPDALSEEINEKEVNIMWFTAGWFNELVDTSSNLFRPLKTILVGGDKLSSTHISKIQDIYPSLEIINGYGPTENTTFSLTHNISKVVENIPIGSPIANSTAYIFDAYQQIVPTGVIGEIYLGGDGVSKGYLNNPELTAAKFIQNPYNSEDTLYRTGDLGRWLDNGVVEFMGRTDDQLKIRGHRVELGEVETQLLQKSSIDKAAVLAKKDEHGNYYLVAYFVANKKEVISEIRTFLSSSLPIYMIPSGYIQLDKMPLTVNGKVDRAALSSIDTEKHIIKDQYEAPITERQQVLCSVWENVLKRTPVGLKDNFYNLGGDSIKCIQIVARLKQEGYSLKVEEILRYPVLGELVQYMKHNQTAIDQAEVTGDVLLTPIQHYFFENANIKNKNHYNQSMFLKITKNIDHEILKKCLHKLAIHHDALRMTFDKVNEVWMQTNLPESETTFDVSYHDITEVENPEKEMQKIGSETQKSFNIENGSLCKAVHFKLKDEDMLFVTIHHLVVDGVSWRIFMEDLSTLYEQFSENKTIKLPSKTHSYQHWAAIQKQVATSKVVQEETSYWDSICSKNVHPIPYDKQPKIKLFTLNGSTSFGLSKEVTELLQTKVHNAYITEINDILIACLGLAIKDVFGTTETLLQMEGHGREAIAEDLDIGRTIGWFTSIFPFVLNHTYEDHLEVLVKVKTDLRKIPNKGIGYGMLRHLNNNEELTYIPGAIFNYLGDFGSKAGNKETSIFEYASQRLGEDVSKKNGYDCPLIVTGMMSYNELSIDITYAKDYYEVDTMRKLAARYQHHLEALILELSSIETRQLTPSDVTFPRLKSRELKTLNTNNNVEDVYELSPLQQGIFYQWLSDKESLAYLEQVSYRLESKNLSIENVQKAYNQLINRYAILRTRFTNDYGGVSLQIVYKSIVGNFEYQSIDALTINDTEAYIENIKLEELRKGFNLEKDFSQMRLKVVELPNNEYEFIWNFHHILMDGWCISILVNDFYKLLLNIESTNATALPTPKPYSDYLSWLTNIDKEKSLLYWNNYLNGYNSLATIPYKKNGLKQNSEKFSRKEIHITGALLEKINKICLAQNITRNTFMQVVWGYLLSRYNDVQDVVFGVVVSGRPGELEGVEEMVGLFINTIPVRMSYTQEDTPTSILQKMHQSDINSKPYHYLNLSEVQAESNLGTDLLDHIMVFENYPVQELIKEDIESHNKQELAIAAVDVIEQTNYNLDLTIELSENSLTVQFNYNEHVYESSGVELISTHLLNVIDRFATEDTKPLANFDFLPEVEKNELLIAYNDNATIYPSNETILDVFEQRVIENPEEIAVVFEDVKLSFKELDILSNQLAHYLKANYSLETGSHVGIKLDRSEWVIVSIFAILKTGSAYIPIDTAYPEDRISFIEEDSQCSVCIDAEFLQEFNKNQSKCSKEKLAIQLSSEALAYIIYTSGSTGYPKGVLVTHASVVNIYYGWKAAYRLDDFKVTLLQLASFSFDMSVADLCRSILTGGTMVICGNDMKLDTTSMCNLITENQVSVFEGTPSFVMPLMRHIHKQKIDVSFLKMIILGAESLNLNDFEFLLLEFGHNSRVINSYGVTEATIDSTYYECEVDTHHELSTTVPIGIPFPNVQLYVLDANKQLVPKGIAGELYIGGEGVAKGYLNRPELTAQKFIANPFNKEELLYKTGDMARWLLNGTLEFLGRSDDQVKIRGYRIELGEIEYQIQQFTAVEDIIVLAKQGAQEYKELVAYFTATEKIESKELRAYLLEKLPSYMLPSYYIQLDKMPLSPNGKVDKKALPEVLEENLQQENFIAPRTPEEKALVSVWNAVLKFENISVKDSFYNLGGDSIKSIQVVARLKQLGYSLKVEQILKNPVLEDLANFVTKNTRIIDQSPVSGEVLLTPIQHYFFTDESIVVKHHHNLPVLLKSSVELDAKVLERCIQKLIMHHDALRMVYSNEDGIWKQYNKGISGKHYTIQYHDLRNVPNELEKLDKLGNDIQSGIDIVNGPLLHVGHFKLSDGDRLALIVHHLVVDGISWRILLEDLTGLYEAEINQTKFELMLKTDSFQSWALAQKEYAHGKSIEKEYSYWEELCRQTIPMLPVDKEASTNGIYHHNQEKVLILDKKITEKLQTKAHKVYKTEANDILLTGLSLAIRDTFQTDQCVIKLEGHGREDIIDDIDISKTVGWFSSEYPVVLDVANVEENIKALVRIKENLRKIPNKGIGYGMLRYLRDDFEGKLHPSIIFNYLGDFGSNAGGTATQGGNQPIFDYASESFGSDTDAKNGQEELIDIYGVLASNQLSINLRYSDKVFNEETMNLLTANYEKYLIAIIEELAASETEHITPSDLTFNELTLEGLASINKDNNIEDIYQLSPLQHGMFYNWSLDPSSNAYFEQISYKLTTSELRMEDIKKAYDLLIQRHTILRTGFTNEYANMILQIVYKSVPDSFSYEIVPEDVDVKEYIKQQKQADISKGFNLYDKVQMRLKVLVLSENNYEFIWSHHHILMDGWCMSILINDFYLILNEVCTGSSSKLPAPVPYANYIDWINKIEEDESLRFWKKYLKGYENIAEVPFQIKEVAPTYKRTHEKLKVDNTTFKKIQSICAKLNITQNTFIQTVWGCLVAKYNNTSDAIFGAVVSGRPADLVGIEEMVGLFINTIPVRIKYNENETPESLLRRSHKEFIDCNQHHYINLSEVQAQSEFGMDLIDHVMIFENYPIQEVIEEDINSNKNESSVGLAIESVNIFDQINYDFSIVVHPEEDKLEICFDYNANMYDSKGIKELATHYNQLLQHFCDSPREKIDQFTYVSEEEKNELLNVFNGPKVPLVENETFMDLFVHHVAENGKNVALYTNDKTFTYEEIHKTSDEFAVFIKEHFNLPKQAIVGINLTRSEWSLISVLAIFKTGAAFLPIDPEYPKERIEYLLNDSKCRYVITEELIKEFMTKKDKYAGSSCKEEIKGDHLAYVIYTSGSTGMPKGVMIEHDGMLNHMHAMVSSLELDANSIIVQNAPSTFDISIWQLLNSLIVGGATSIYEKATLLNPQRFLERVQREKVTILQVVPSYLKPLLQIEKDLQQSYLSNVKYLLVTGEAVSKELIKEWFNRYPSIKVVNAYGPAEASDDVTLHFMDQVPESSNIPIGKPIQNMSIFILDENLQLCGKNIIGEICVAGIGLGRGYLHREELTSEKFVKNPFNKNEYLYRTGDLGRWLPDGTLEFYGRIDDQVKIHGFRVELGEIEYQLMIHEAIEQAVVIVKEEESGNKELAAYLVSEEKLDIAEIREYLLKRLPDFMCPAFIIQLEKLPLSANGKIDKKALTKIGDAETEANPDYVPPRNEKEEKLVKILAKELNKDEHTISVTDNFFDIGMTSIKLLKVMHSINKAFDDIKIKPRVLFEYSNIVELVENVFTPKEVIEEEITEEEVAVDVLQDIDDFLSEIE
jgi:putative pyridoxal-dependent aspartate 1-decarboxylase